MKTMLFIASFLLSLIAAVFAEDTKASRINAASELTTRLEHPLIQGLWIEAFAKGKNCDIMHVESRNLLPGMMESLAEGRVNYGKVLPGGVNNYAAKFGFKSILYTSRADNSFVSYGESSISRSAIKKMKACSNESSKNNKNSSISKKDSAQASKGKDLIRKIHKQYHIHSFYSEPDKQGTRMVIWLPERAWRKLSPTEKGYIKAYMKSLYPDKDTGIGIGRIDGVDIIADDIISIE